MDLTSTILNLILFGIIGFVIYFIYTKYKTCGLNPICYFVNLKDCPEGSYSSGLTCIQSINSYATPLFEDCRDGYHHPAGDKLQCDQSCLPGFTLRSTALGSSFCDKSRV
jgi:hypothetical protein